MKLLTSVLPRGGRILPAGGWFTLGVCAAVAGLEVAGRYATSDLHDVVAAFALMALAVAVAARHRRAPLTWVRRLGGWARRAVAKADGFRLEHGFDLRGSPPLPRRTPRSVWLMTVALVTWAGFAGLVHTWKVGTYESTIGPANLFAAVAAVFFGASQLRRRPNVWGALIAMYALAFGVQGLRLTFLNGINWIEKLFEGVSLLVAVALASRQGIVRIRKRPATPPGSTGAATTAAVESATAAST